MGKKKKSKHPQGRRFRWEEELKYNYRHYIQAAKKHLEIASELREQGIKKTGDKEKFDPYYPLSELEPAYIRAAGHVAWMSVILATLAFFKKNEQRLGASVKNDFRDVKEFRKGLSKLGKSKLLDLFNDLYNTLHLAIGYDGNMRPVKIYEEFKKIRNFIAQIEKEL